MNHEIKVLETKFAEISSEHAIVRQKMAALEKAGRAHRRATLILSGLLIFSVALGLLTSKTFSGRWLAVHDKQDHISAWWDDSGLELHDAGGVVRAKLGLLPDGSPYLQFFDKHHRLRSQLFLYDGNGYLMLWDKAGKGVRVPPGAAPSP